ncbi:MAG: tonB-system energizer ExbB [Acetobacteraceae bacterium]
MKRVLLPVLASWLTAGPALAAETGRPLPTELSPLAMFRAADIVVQAVMVGLLAASVLAWLVLFAKRIEITLAARRLRQICRAMATSAGLNEATAARRSPDRVADALLDAARDEMARSHDLPSTAGVQDRIAIRMARIEAASAREIGMGVSLLATIGATAPFVGLFGTVWGIMNSFIGISKAQTTNLAVVAPGIAEALLATAIGLIAAIPAVIFYNHLTRSIGAYRALVGDAVALVTVLATRDLDRARAPTGQAD